MDENVLKSLEEKKARVRTTLKNQKADKIPFVMWRSDYLIYYFGYEMAQIDSFDQLVNILKRGSEELQFDLCDPVFPIKPFYVPQEAVYGGSMMRISPDYNTTQIDPGKIQIMTQEDYPTFIDDPINAMLEKLLPRRLKLLAEGTVEEKLNRYSKLNEVNTAVGEYTRRLTDEVGLLGTAHHFFTMPVDILFDFFRDFSGIIRDIRKCPEYVIEAADKLADLIIQDMSKAPVLDYSTTTAALHLPPFIKPKDFEKVYWPSFKKIVETAHAQGRVCKFLFEKSWSHLFEFLEELPKNSVIGYFERDDDFREVCRRLGDRMIIAGGIDTNLLARGTKQQCIDSVKSIIDDTCNSGGVMLVTDMPLLYSKDAIPENFKAVADTIATYGRY